VGGHSGGDRILTGDAAMESLQPEPEDRSGWVDPAVHIEPPHPHAGLFYRARWRFSDLLWVAIFIGVYFALGLAVTSIADLYREVVWIRVFLLGALIGLEVGIPLYLLRYRRAGLPERIPILSRGVDILSGFGVYLLLIPVLIGMSFLLDDASPENLVERLNILRDENLGFQVALILVAFTVVPVAEEIFFRGFIHNTLRARFRPWPAILLQALFFALLHFYTLTYPLYIFWVGLALGWIYEKRKRLLAPIATHACFNFIGSLVVLLSVMANQHEPASSWEQAQDVLGPPPEIYRYVLEQELSQSGPEEVYLESRQILGEEGLGMWKVEAEVLRAYSWEVQDESRSADALLEAARLYQVHGDPRRAFLLCESILENSSPEEEIHGKAARLKAETGLTLFLDRPNADTIGIRPVGEDPSASTPAPTLEERLEDGG
jgi:membrane protease YdiL (CAAX protease family)